MLNGLRHQSRSLWLVLVDLVTIVLCINAGYLIRYSGNRPFISAIETPILYTGATTVLVFVVLVFLYVVELYRSDMRFTKMKLAERVFIATIGIFVVITAAFYVMPQKYILGRGHLALTMIPLPFMLYMWRWLYIRFVERRLPTRRTVVLGAGVAGKKLLGLLNKHHNHPYNVIGFADRKFDAESDEVAEVEGIPLIGTDEALATMVKENQVNTIIVAIIDTIDQKVMDQLIELKFSGTTVEQMGAVYRTVSGRVPIRQSDGRYFLYSDGFAASQQRFRRLTQRLFDLFFAFLMAVILFPFSLFVAMIVKLESRGTVFFIQERVGLNGALFRMIKFRTMTEEAPKSGEWMNGEQKVHQTRIGSFLRKTRINEIPQLINILRGDMSLIGPRPETPQYVEELVKEIPFYHLRHFVKPGLSGWAAVNTGYAATVAETERVIEYDLYYIEKMSIRLNLLILLKTVSTVLFRPGQ